MESLTVSQLKDRCKSLNIRLTKSDGSSKLKKDLIRSLSSVESNTSSSTTSSVVGGRKRSSRKSSKRRSSRKVSRKRGSRKSSKRSSRKRGSRKSSKRRGSRKVSRKRGSRKSSKRRGSRISSKRRGSRKSSKRRGSRKSSKRRGSRGKNVQTGGKPRRTKKNQYGGSKAIEELMEGDGGAAMEFITELFKYPDDLGNMAEVIKARGAQVDNVTTFFENLQKATIETARKYTEADEAIDKEFLEGLKDFIKNDAGNLSFNYDGFETANMEIKADQLEILVADAGGGKNNILETWYNSIDTLMGGLRLNDFNPLIDVLTTFKDVEKVKLEKPGYMSKEVFEALVKLRGDVFTNFKSISENLTTLNTVYNEMIELQKYKEVLKTMNQIHQVITLRKIIHANIAKAKAEEEAAAAAAAAGEAGKNPGGKEPGKLAKLSTDELVAKLKVLSVEQLGDIPADDLLVLEDEQLEELEAQLSVQQWAAIVAVAKPKAPKKKGGPPGPPGGDPGGDEAAAAAESAASLASIAKLKTGIGFLSQIVGFEIQNNFKNLKLEWINILAGDFNTLLSKPTPENLKELNRFVSNNEKEAKVNWGELATSIGLEVDKQPKQKLEMINRILGYLDKDEEGKVTNPLRDAIAAPPAGIDVSAIAAEKIQAIPFVVKADSK